MAGEVVTVKVEGLDQLRTALLRLPFELQQGPLRAAVAAAAKVVQERAMQNAPVDRGVLKKAVYRKFDKKNSSSVQAAYIVGIRYGRRYRKRGLDAWYWIFDEFGTSKQPARPFFRPAFDATHAQQIEALRAKLADGIEKVAKKLAYRRTA